ncbi:MAG: YARHG domain-containing protein [Pseudomonadota bacterium]
MKNKGMFGEARLFPAIIFTGWLFFFIWFATAPPQAPADEFVTTEELYEQVSKILSGQADRQTLPEKLVGRSARLEGRVREIRGDSLDVIVLTSLDEAGRRPSCLIKFVENPSPELVVVGDMIRFTGKVDSIFLGSVIISEAKLITGKKSVKNSAKASPPEPSTILGATENNTTAHDSNFSPWIFPDSDKKYLDKSEIIYLDKETLWKARNEIFARKGYIFSSDKGRNYAQSLGDAYIPKTNSISLNDFERYNVQLLKEHEK